MKEYYQPKGGKKGKFALRENTYRRTWYLIADYPYFKKLQEEAGCLQTDKTADALHEGDAGDTQVFGSLQPARAAESAAEYNTGGNADVVESKIEGGNADAGRKKKCGRKKLKTGYEPDPRQFSRYIAAIEEAQQHVPAAYMDYVMDHIVNKMKYKDADGVSEKTLKIWTQRFVWYVAHNLGDV